MHHHHSSTGNNKDITMYFVVCTYICKDIGIIYWSLTIANHYLGQAGSNKSEFQSGRNCDSNKMYFVFWPQFIHT